jgi:hypothetical protein
MQVVSLPTSKPGHRVKTGGSGWVAETRSGRPPAFQIILSSEAGSMSRASEVTRPGVASCVSSPQMPEGRRALRCKSAMLTASELRRIARRKDTHMPDLTIESHWHCASQMHTHQVGPYTVSGMFDERTWPTCTCKAYQFATNGRTNFGGRMVPNPCKHIQQVEAETCQYHSMVHGMPEQDGVCPLCGGSLEGCLVAV